jgi:hypothetical protein
MYAAEASIDGMIYTKFNEDWYSRSCNIKVLPHQFERL